MTILTEKLLNNINFGNVLTGINVPYAISGDQIVPLYQVQSLLSSKQNTITASHGIKILNNDVRIDLGSNDASLVLSNQTSANAIFNGTYTIVDGVTGSFTKSGNDFTFEVNASYNVFSKFSNNHYQLIAWDGSTFVAIDTIMDPSYLTEGDVLVYDGTGSDSWASTGDVDTADYDLLLLLPADQENDADSRLQPATSSDINYPTYIPSGLSVTGTALSIDRASDIDSSAIGKYFDSSQVQTKIDNALLYAGNSANISFSNATASITGNPNNVQSMGNALASEIDSVNALVSTNTNNINTNINDITTNTTDIATNASDIATNKSDNETSLGLVLGADLGAGFSVIDNNLDIKSGISQLDSKLSQYSSGNISWEIVDELSASNISLLGTSYATGERILVIGQTLNQENGIYVADASGNLTRASGADTSNEFSQGRRVYVSAIGTFQYTGESSPVIDTDAITFDQISDVDIADGSITEVKLSSSVQSKLFNNYPIAPLALTAGNPVDIIHNLGNQYPMSVIADDSDKQDSFSGLIIVYTDENTMRVQSGVDVTITGVLYG